MSTKRPSIIILSELIQKFVGSDFDDIESVAANLEAILGTTGLTLTVDYSENGFPQTTLGDLLDAITEQVNENTTDVASLSTLSEAIANNATAIAAVLADLGFINANLTTGRLYQGGYDANTNTPDLENPLVNTVLKGYSYDVTVAGTFNLDDGTIALNVGDNIRAVVDNPANVADWVQIPVTLNAATIKTQYESNADTNAFDDAAQAKLAGIEASATADQTGAEIVALYEAEAGTWQSGSDRAKLDGIEAGAKGDQTAAEVPYNNATSLLPDTNVQGAIDTLDSRLDAIEDGFPASDIEYSNATSGIASANVQGAIDIVDNRLDTAETKLAGIEAGADVTDAVNVNAAGAVMNSDTSTAAMSFVIDEDDMASDSPTKVPTQQSVKAYVDNIIGGSGAYVVWVNELSDLPTPSAGVITLAANTMYMVTDSIALGTNRIQMANNSGFWGTNPKNSALVYTGTGNLITASAGVTHMLFDLKISAASGAALSLSGGATETAYYRGLEISASANNCLISNWYAFFWQNGSSVLGGAGMTFAGTCNILIIDLVEFIIWDNSIPAIDLGVATFNTLSFVRCGFTGLGGSGQHGIKKAAGNTNLNPDKIAKVKDCRFATTLTAGIQNYDSGDIQWHYDDNENGAVADSQKIADFYMQTNATATAATTTPTLIAGTWTIAKQKQFTVTAAGRATYNGIQTTTFKLRAELFCDTASGSNQRYYFHVYKNGVAVVETRITKEFDSTDPDSTAIFAEIELATNDYIEVFVTKVTGSDNITIEDAHVIISE